MDVVVKRADAAKVGSNPKSTQLFSNVNVLKLLKSPKTAVINL